MFMFAPKDCRYFDCCSPQCSVLYIDYVLTVHWMDTHSLLTLPPHRDSRLFLDSIDGAVAGAASPQFEGWRTDHVVDGLSCCGRRQTLSFSVSMAAVAALQCPLFDRPDQTAWHCLFLHRHHHRRILHEAGYDLDDLHLRFCRWMDFMEWAGDSMEIVIMLAVECINWMTVLNVLRLCSYLLIQNWRIIDVWNQILDKSAIFKHEQVNSI